MSEQIKTGIRTESSHPSGDVELMDAELDELVKAGSERFRGPDANMSVSTFLSIHVCCGA